MFYNIFFINAAGHLDDIDTSPRSSRPTEAASHRAKARRSNPPRQRAPSSTPRRLRPSNYLSIFAPTTHEATHQRPRRPGSSTPSTPRRHRRNRTPATSGDRTHTTSPGRHRHNQQPPLLWSIQNECKSFSKFIAQPPRAFYSLC